MAHPVGDLAGRDELWVYTGDEPLEDLDEIDWSDLRETDVWPAPGKIVLLVPSSLSGSNYGSGDLTTRINHDLFLEDFGDRADVVDVSGPQRAYGVGILADSEDDDLRRALEGLEQYPLYAEDRHYAHEQDAEIASWEGYARREYLSRLTDRAPDVATEELLDLLESFDVEEGETDPVYDLFETVRERAGMEWLTEGQDRVVDVEKVAAATDLDDVLEAMEVAEPAAVMDLLHVETELRGRLSAMLDSDQEMLSAGALGALVDALWDEGLQPSLATGAFDDADLAERLAEHDDELDVVDIPAFARSLSPAEEARWNELADRWLLVRQAVDVLLAIGQERGPGSSSEQRRGQGQTYFRQVLPSMEEVARRQAADPTGERVHGGWSATVTANRRRRR
jgi:hypothetical protein